VAAEAEQREGDQGPVFDDALLQLDEGRDPAATSPADPTRRGRRRPHRGSRGAGTEHRDGRT